MHSLGCAKLLDWGNPSKRGGVDGVFQGHGYSEGFPMGAAPGKSQGAALPAQGKPRASKLFFSDLHSFSNKFSPLSKRTTKCQAETFFLEG